MKTRNAVALAAVASAAALGAPAAAGAAVINPPIATLDTESVFVDSRTGTVTTTLPLLPIVSYTVKVEGTYSPFAATLYNRPTGSYFTTCGTPLTAPKFPTPSIANGPTGFDSEFVFAAPVANFKCGNFKPPTAVRKFEIDTGDGFEDPTPLGGQPTSPSSTHTYKYRVHSKSLLKRARFKIVDSNRKDNYGRLKVTISLDVL